jgi:pimaricinolide synthase PimS1
LRRWRPTGTAGGRIAASLGFSIGAYAALVGAGAVTIGQVVRMIDIVLEASLGLLGHFAMLAVIGAPAEALERLYRPGAVELAAVIAPGQFLIAGREDAVRELGERVEHVALKVKALSVRWPLHTSLMKPVASELERRREEVGQLRPLRHPVYSALHGGRIESPQEAWRLLVEHLFLCQRFDRAFQAARDQGVARYVQLGPGGTLERAVRWLDRGEVEVETFPASPARVRPGRKMRC